VEKAPLHFNLQMLNLWIGLSRRDPALPSVLADLGYRDFVIEKPFSNSRRHIVKPELILTSESVENSLLLEFKSGSNTEVEQIERYQGILSADLERIEIAIPAAKTHDVVFVGHSSERDRLRIGIVATACGFPLLLLESDGLQLELNEFVVETLTQEFRSRLRFNVETAPTGYVPIGPDSELWEVAEVVMPVVISGMHERKSRMSVSEVAADACHETWGVLDRSARTDIKVKTGAVLQQAARREFSDHLTYSGASRMLTITRGPLDLAPSRRTSALQTLIRAQSQMLDRLRRASGTASGEQLELDLDDQPSTPHRE
jgi:hypothetical protein